jgi:hypothetical protein
MSPRFAATTRGKAGVGTSRCVKEIPCPLADRGGSAYRSWSTRSRPSSSSLPSSWPPPGADRTSEACPAGYTSLEELKAKEIRRLEAAGAVEGAGRERLEGLCVSNKHPESLAELSIARSERAAIYNSPNGTVPATARENAIAEPGTGTDGWRQVFDLGTAQHPGDATVEATPQDPANSSSSATRAGRRRPPATRCSGAGARPGHVSSNSFQVILYTDEASATLTSPQMMLPADSSVAVTWWQPEHRGGLRLRLRAVVERRRGVARDRGCRLHRAEPELPGLHPDVTSFVAPAGSLFIRFQLASDQLVSSPPYEGVALDDVLVQR